MSIVFKILKRLLVATITLFCIGVIVFFAWRINSGNTPNDLKTITPNASLCEAYGRDGKDLYMFFQPRQLEYTANEDANGYFFVSETAIIPAANQVQTVVRYNNSTLKGITERYSLDAIPERESEVFEYSLVVAIDLTPDDKEDNLSTDEDKVKMVECRGEVVATATKNMYNFRRVVFDFASTDIDLEALVNDGTLIAIYMEYFYVGAQEGEDALANLCLYDYLNDNERVKLSGKDKKALEAFCAN